MSSVGYVFTPPLLAISDHFEVTSMIVEIWMVLGGLTFKNRGHWGSRYIYPKGMKQSGLVLHDTVIFVYNEP